MDLFGKSPRPVFNYAMLNELSGIIGKRVFDWCNGETELEDCISDTAEILKWHHGDNGYELAKQFEDKGYDPDTQLVEELDCVWHEKSDIQKTAIKKWVTEDNIQPELSEGTMVSFPKWKGVSTGEIVKIYTETAQYGVWVESDAYEKGKGHSIVDYEKVTATARETT